MKVNWHILHSGMGVKITGLAQNSYWIDHATLRSLKAEILKAEWRKYEVEIVEIFPNNFKKIFEDSDLEVFQIPLKHRGPTCGFLFKEPCVSR